MPSAIGIVGYSYSGSRRKLCYRIIITHPKFLRKLKLKLRGLENVCTITNVFTKGVGKHKEKLTSFEMALRDAKIAAFNLVSVSSIFPRAVK